MKTHYHLIRAIDTENPFTGPFTTYARPYACNRTLERHRARLEARLGRDVASLIVTVPPSVCRHCRPKGK